MKAISKKYVKKLLKNHGLYGSIEILHGNIGGLLLKYNVSEEDYNILNRLYLYFIALEMKEEGYTIDKIMKEIKK